LWARKQKKANSAPPLYHLDREAVEKKNIKSFNFLNEGFGICDLRFADPTLNNTHKPEVATGRETTTKPMCHNGSKYLAYTEMTKKNFERNLGCRSWI